VHSLIRKYTLGNHFLRTLWNSLVTWVKWKLVSVHLQIVVTLVLCAEYTTGMEFFLPHPMDLLGDVGQTEAQFGLIRDSVNLDARTVYDLHRTCNRLKN
jgi:hypothetical protein